MEPLKPEAVKELLNRPQIDPADVDEYQRLLCERFMIDPDAQASPQQAATALAVERRLKVLHDKLFAERAPAPR
jgi:hypothetical protein